MLAIQHPKPYNSSDMMFEVNEVEYEYNERERVLQGVTLSVGRGEFLAVIGRNGSGKSTFAKLLNALLIPTRGELRVLGLLTADENNVLKIRQMAGMVFQNPDNQLVTTIVEEDVAFGPENLGVPSEEIRERVDAALAKVGMTKYARYAPHMLSGGQKQRVAIAGILAMRPDAVIFDESTAMLDPKGRREVMSALTQLHNEGITVILITHFMEEAALAQRVLVFDDGRIAADAPPRELFRDAELLDTLGLSVPYAVELREMLRRAGIDAGGAMNMDEMVEAICRLLPKN